MMDRNLILRCDASVAMGTGHLMRCLALAEAWQDKGGGGTFAMAESFASHRQRLVGEGFQIAVVDAPAGSLNDAYQLVDLARSQNSSSVVVDGYQFSADYQNALKAEGLKVLWIDDFSPLPTYSADFLLNQNIYAEKAMYRQKEPNTRTLLGPRFLLLRREFRAFQGVERKVPPVGRKVLVTMGGSDPENVTARVMKALDQVNVEGLDATVVLGAGNPHLEFLRKEAQRLAARVRLFHDVSNMAQLMAASDVAVSAAGTTCWEICHLGLPSLLIPTASNQFAIAQSLHDLGAALMIGNAAEVSSDSIADSLSHLLLSFDTRQSMAVKGPRLVDGRGATRVAQLLATGVRLRRARACDCSILWGWANDREARRASFCSDPIPWDQHMGWFQTQLADPSAVLYIGEIEKGIPIGYVRYRIEGNIASLSISIGSEFRGKGYGQALLLLANEELLCEMDLEEIRAFVKTDNQVSRHIFAAAGFFCAGVDSVNGHSAVRFVLERSGTA